MGELFKKMLFLVTAVFVLVVLNVCLAEAKSLKKGEVYRSFDGEAIEVISGSELEITQGKEITIAKYGFKDDKLRAVFGDKVIYFEITKVGLEEEKTGKGYYTKAGLAVFRKEGFIISDLTVLHKETKLIWTRDAYIAGKSVNRDDALKFIESLNQQKYAGYSDWRLPSKDELETLVNFARANGFKKNINYFFAIIGFKNVADAGYWSSTTDANDTTRVWVVNMINPGRRAVDKTMTGFVWPVRAGQ